MNGYLSIYLNPLKFLIDQEEDTDYYDSRRSSARRRFEEDLEMEARAEKRIISAKKAFYFDFISIYLHRPLVFFYFLCCLELVHMIKVILDSNSQGHKDIMHKSSVPASKSSRQPVDYSESEREESEYETEGEEDERSLPHGRDEDMEPEYEEEEEHDEEEEEANEDSHGEEVSSNF